LKNSPQLALHSNLEDISFLQNLNDWSSAL
jgi:hypothetical protein